MNNFTFYIYFPNGVKENLTLKEAIAAYKGLNLNEGYTALGVKKNGLYACDMVNNLGSNNSIKISNDYAALDNFKHDALITNNLVKILKKEFNL